jgi:hypothetical protein
MWLFKNRRFRGTDQPHQYLDDEGDEDDDDVDNDGK